MVQSAKLIPSLNLKALPSHRAYARLARVTAKYTLYNIWYTSYNIHNTLCGIVRAWARVSANWRARRLRNERFGRASTAVGPLQHHFSRLASARISKGHSSFNVPATETESSASLCLNKAEIFHSLRNWKKLQWKSMPVHSLLMQLLLFPFYNVGFLHPTFACCSLHTCCTSYFPYELLSLKLESFP